jgi:serralysin
MATSSVGPSTPETPYLVPTAPGVGFTSIISAGDEVIDATNPDRTAWRFVGIPDGIGAFDNGDGTATVLVNHEIGATNGVVREHGSVGAFVGRLIVDVDTLEVLAADDLGDTIYRYDAATGAFFAGTTAIGRLCSADLALPSAFFDAASGKGTQDRILLNGEETGPEGRAFAWIATGAEQGDVYELPHLGKFSWENAVASPNSGEKTVVIGLDDFSSDPLQQVYVYVGEKQGTGNTVERAGLASGELWGIRAGFASDGEGAPERSAFVLENLGDVSGKTGAELEAASDAAGLTGFGRPEDGAWDTQDPNRFYFATTGAGDVPTRLWALDFVDVARPELGGTITQLLDGSEGIRSLDNLTVSDTGKVVIQEDPGNNPRLAKVWHYDPETDGLVEIARHDRAKFGDETTAPVAPFTQDEESSGVVDVTDIFGRDGGQAYLLDTQAHYPFGAPGSAGRTEIVEGGQLMLMRIDADAAFV